MHSVYSSLTYTVCANTCMYYVFKYIHLELANFESSNQLQNAWILIFRVATDHGISLENHRDIVITRATRVSYRIFWWWGEVCGALPQHHASFEYETIIFLGEEN